MRARNEIKRALPGKPPTPGPQDTVWVTMAMLRFTSSYERLDAQCRWLRGNHHGHSTVSDGRLAPMDLVRIYEEAGYHYFALSEHDRLLAPDTLQPHTSMCIVPAIEVTSRLGQTLLYLGADRELPGGQWLPWKIMEEVHAAGGLFIFDHPNWRPWPDYAGDELLDRMTGLKGMEIYTGVIERLPGSPRATDRWDRLLSKGWRVFGHGTDDQHDDVDHFIAWNCVQWPEAEPLTPKGIVTALAKGRFYASTGVAIQRVGVNPDGETITVDSDADAIHWVACNGVTVMKVQGGTSRLVLSDFIRLPAVQASLRPAGNGGSAASAPYVRAECLGHGNAAAWTQPFWVVEV